MKIKNPIIFMDLDGVMANMDKAVIDKFGFPFEHVDNLRMWTMISVFEPDIFAKLEMMPDAHILLEGLKGHPFNVLSAIPSMVAMPQSVDHKYAWSMENLAKYNLKEILFGPYAKNKQNHCKGSNYILIDDKARNCKQWTSKGGIAILHTSAESTLASLKEYVSL